MSYTYYGDPSKPILMFIHGAGVGGWMWDKQVEYFKQSYYCIVPTYQFSEQQLIRYWADTFLQELLKHKTEGKQVILVGFSMGAQISVEMCASEPESFSHVMVNSGLVDPKPILQKMVVPLLPIFNILPKSRSFSMKQAKELYIGEQYFERYYEGAKRVTNVELRLVMKENLEFDLPEGLERFTGEMLITIGEKEEKLLKRSVEKLKRAVPDARIEVIPNVKHGFSLAEPASFNEMLEEWIQANSIDEQTN